MIQRLLATLVLLWTGGFVLFSIDLPRPAGPDRTDGIVVLTGGPGRVQRGTQALAAGEARRMLISGVDPRVTEAEMASLYRIPVDLRDAVDLGRTAVDTRSNAAETAAWIAQHDYHSIRLVTTDWHMRRARFELGHTVRGVRIVTDAVPSEPGLVALLREYNKFLLRRASALIGH
ncbi:YdcF family protein [Sphingomonas nostoxanthinifaciens]|uniref:YdcF family protein n=1 Tax=Sphingomonas nostoxanthinifaciens TaxID=2872652 RepID=UPI001CC1C421|nr:YdcF family protein [Sphingomonas nostoxanthinifaciens]UAK22961.1 YdcF family protein [Sphingomonas nostoxanthinifaciens]